MIEMNLYYQLTLVRIPVGSRFFFDQYIGCPIVDLQNKEVMWSALSIRESAQTREERVREPGTPSFGSDQIDLEENFVQS